MSAMIDGGGTTAHDAGISCSSCPWRSQQWHKQGAELELGSTLDPRDLSPALAGIFFPLSRADNHIDFLMAALFLAMTRKLCAHWKANANANPKKFMLTSEQHKEYFDSCVRCGADLAIIDAAFHMGVPIEVVENTPGVMVAADGAQVFLR